jgi:hypothetical protein
LFLRLYLVNNGIGDRLSRKHGNVCAELLRFHRLYFVPNAGYHRGSYPILFSAIEGLVSLPNGGEIWNRQDHNIDLRGSSLLGDVSDWKE